MPQLTPEWLQFEQNMGGRSCLKGTPEEMRAQFDGLVAALAPHIPPPDPEVIRKEQTIDGVRCLIFTPASASTGGGGGQQKLPLGVFFHSGGFVLGLPEGEAVPCELIAKHTPAIVISVDYPKSPENKHPAALEAAIKVYSWAWKNAASLGADPAAVFPIGGSAGGGIALSVASHFVAKPETKSMVRGCVAMVPTAFHPSNPPPAPYTEIYKSYTENADDVPVIDTTSMQQFYTYAAADPHDAANFVGLATQNHALFPPTYFCACECDPLRDDAVVMERMLQAAGVKTKIDMYKGLPHYFWIFPGIPEAQAFVENLLGGVKFVLEG